MSTIIPSWVEPDPAREVAVDALGLTWQADQLADALLPELSVLTRRARYLSFLAWAVSKSASSADPERSIHQLEARLALHEAGLHDGDPEQCLGVVGRARALSYIRQYGNKAPAHPERLYKSTAFRAYRPLLRSAGLLDGSTTTLTSEGRRLAKVFGMRAQETQSCLSEIKGEEKKLLRRALGFDLRFKANSREKLRRETLDELRKRFHGEKLHPALILPLYARKPLNGKQPVRLLFHKAYVWEVLSLGLNLAFVCVLRDMNLAPFASLLEKARKNRPHLPELTHEFTCKDEDAPRHVVALLRHACSLKPSALGLQREAEDLARVLLDKSGIHFLECLLARHETAKGAEAWVQLSGTKKRLRRLASPRKGFPDRADLHPYRLSAFYELGEDLDLWR